MARNVREVNQTSTNCNEMLETKNHTLWWNGRRSSQSINELIREIDWKNEEDMYTTKKYKEKSEWIDMEARKVFKGGISSSMLKCAYGYNHCGTKKNNK